MFKKNIKNICQNWSFVLRSFVLFHPSKPGQGASRPGQSGQSGQSGWSGWSGQRTGRPWSVPTQPRKKRGQKTTKRMKPGWMWMDADGCVENSKSKCIPQQNESTSVDTTSFPNNGSAVKPLVATSMRISTWTLDRLDRFGRLSFRRLLELHKDRSKKDIVLSTKMGFKPKCDIIWYDKLRCFFWPQKFPGIMFQHQPPWPNGLPRSVDSGLACGNCGQMWKTSMAEQREVEWNKRHPRFLDPWGIRDSVSSICSGG